MHRGVGSARNRLASANSRSSMTPARSSSRATGACRCVPSSSTSSSVYNEKKRKKEKKRKREIIFFPCCYLKIDLKRPLRIAAAAEAYQNTLNGNEIAF